MTAPAGEGNTATSTAQGGGSENSSTGEQSPSGNQFSPITIESQEEFDKLLGSRLARQERTIRAEFPDYDDFKAKATEFDKLQEQNKSEAQRMQEALEEANKKLADSDARATAAELANLRNKVAADLNLPLKFAPKLSGATEEELIADAKETFGDLLGTTTTSFDHGPRSQSTPQSMNDVIFGAARRR